MNKKYILVLISAFILGATLSCKRDTVYKTLIISGVGDVGTMTSSDAIRHILDAAGIFSASVINTPPEGEDISGFNPDFSKYKLVVIDYEGQKWPEKTTAALMEYVNNGGGVVYYDSKKDPASGTSDSVTVSKKHPFEIRMSMADHPVTKGLPVRWLHPDDEIIQGIKVGGDGSQLLATAFSDTSFAGSGKREPVLFARTMGKGRIFSTLIGAPDGEENPALHCTGFIVTLQRGAEWAASGKVTQEVPYDFPTAAGPSLRDDFKIVTLNEAFERICSYDISRSTKYYTCIQNSIRKAAGDANSLLLIEKKMTGVLNNKNATLESKKLMLRELSWMGTDFCLPYVRELANVPDLKDAVDFTLERIK